MLVETLVTAILLLNPKLPMFRAIEIASALRTHCPGGLHKYALAIISVESDFHRLAVSDTHDYGLFQVHRTPNSQVPLDQLFQVEPNVRIGCEILFSTWFQYGDKYPDDWYGFYNSNKETARQKYVKKVQFKLKVINHLFRRSNGLCTKKIDSKVPAHAKQ